MLIRCANEEDLNSIIHWYKNFENEGVFEYDLGKPDNLNIDWLKGIMRSKQNKILIGEYKNHKLGLCKFSRSNIENIAHVSVNMSPERFAKPFQRKLLKAAIKRYLKSNDVELYASVLLGDDDGVKFFEDAGFIIYRINVNHISLKYIKNKLTFRKVEFDDNIVLYDLLKNRRHGISHQSMPTFAEHNIFMKNHPYLHWFLIIDDFPIGTVYIQSNNSIGLNFLEVKNEWVSQAMNFINSQFQPNRGILSMIPSYFYLNTAADDEDMIASLSAIGMNPIQISYKI